MGVPRFDPCPRFFLKPAAIAVASYWYFCLACTAVFGSNQVRILSHVRLLMPNRLALLLLLKSASGRSDLGCGFILIFLPSLHRFFLVKSAGIWRSPALIGTLRPRLWLHAQCFCLAVAWFLLKVGGEQNPGDVAGARCSLVFAQVRILFALPGHNCGLNCSLVFAQVRILFALPGHNCGLKVGGEQSPGDVTGARCTVVVSPIQAVPSLHRCFWLKSAIVWRSPALSEADVGNTVRCTQFFKRPIAGHQGQGKCPSSNSGRSSSNHSQKPAVAIVVQGEEFAGLSRDDRILGMSMPRVLRSKSANISKHKDYLSALTKGQLTKMCERLQVSKVGTKDVLRANLRSYFTALEASAEAAKEDTTAAESEVLVTVALAVALAVVVVPAAVVAVVVVPAAVVAVAAAVFAASRGQKQTLRRNQMNLMNYGWKVMTSQPPASPSKAGENQRTQSEWPGLYWQTNVNGLTQLVNEDGVLSEFQSLQRGRVLYFAWEGEEGERAMKMRVLGAPRETICDHVIPGNYVVTEALEVRQDPQLPVVFAPKFHNPVPTISRAPLPQYLPGRNVLQETIAKLFSRFGTVVEAVVMRDRTNGASRGFGFVTFQEPQAVTAVLRELLVLEDRRLDCKLAFSNVVGKN
eukprot:g75435.t1